jgi:hypothetical protein
MIDKNYTYAIVGALIIAYVLGFILGYMVGKDQSKIKEDKR